MKSYWVKIRTAPVTKGKKKEELGLVECNADDTERFIHLSISDMHERFASTCMTISETNRVIVALQKAVEDAKANGK